MIIINRNGEQRVITGWREWLIWIAVAAGIVVVGSLMLGAALTLFTVAIFTIPIAIVMMLIAGFIQGRR